MSYIRCGWPLTYVDGYSEDYIYEGSNGIEDYGRISDSGFIELLYCLWDIPEDYEMFKQHFIKRLAKRLNVKLRDKPLTEEQYEKLCDDRIKEVEKEMKIMEGKGEKE